MTEEQEKITGKWEVKWKTNWNEDWKKFQKEKWDKNYRNGNWNKDWKSYWKQFSHMKWEQGDWNKDWEIYWKQFWNKKWHDQGMYKIQPAMGKIMKEMWKTQRKTSKLIIMLAKKKDDEKFQKEIEDLEKSIITLQNKIEDKYGDLK